MTTDPEFVLRLDGPVADFVISDLGRVDGGDRFGVGAVNEVCKGDSGGGGGCRASSV